MEPIQHGNRSREGTRVDDGAEVQLFVLDGCPCCICKIEGVMVRSGTRSTPIHSADAMRCRSDWGDMLKNEARKRICPFILGYVETSFFLLFLI